MSFSDEQYQPVVVQLPRCDANESLCSSTVEQELDDYDLPDIEHLEDQIKTSLGIQDDEDVKLGVEQIEAHRRGATNRNYIIYSKNLKTGQITRVAVMRQFRENLTTFVSVKAEIDAIKLAASHSISPKFLCEIPNGFCTQYLKYKSLKPRSIRRTDISLLVVSAIASFNKLTKSNSFDYSRPSMIIDELYKKIKLLNKSHDKGLARINRTRQRLLETAQFLADVDRLAISSGQDRIIAHLDTNSTNLLFTGLKNFNDPQADDSFEELENAKCWLIDYGLICEASYVYEFASFLYLSAEYPRMFDKCRRDPAYLTTTAKLYLKIFDEDYSESSVESFLRRVEYAMLVFSFRTLLIQIDFYCHIQPSVYDFEKTVLSERDFFDRQYKRLFGQMSFSEALASLQ